MTSQNTENLDPNIQIVLQKADEVATDVLKLIDEQLLELGIDDENMRSALKFAIIKKMEAKINLPK